MPEYKTLILNGSPRANGNCAGVIEYISPKLHNITRLDLYKTTIAPCIDCRICRTRPGCVINDDFELAADPGFSHIILVSPVYIGGLTPPVFSLATRFQADYSARRFSDNPIPRPGKRGCIILTGGGDGDPKHAISTARWMFKWLNAKVTGIVSSLNTDTAPALEDSEFMQNLDNILLLLYSRPHKNRDV